MRRRCGDESGKGWKEVEKESKRRKGERNSAKKVRRIGKEKKTKKNALEDLV